MRFLSRPFRVMFSAVLILFPAIGKAEFGGTITGTVRDAATNNPIQGALVSNYYATDAAGRFSLFYQGNVQNVFSVAHEQYVTNTFSAIVGINQTVDVGNIMLTKRATVTMILRDAISDRLVANYSVVFSRASQQVSRTADGNGMATVYLDPGSASIQVQHRYYKTIVRDFPSLTSGQSVDLGTLNPVRADSHNLDIALEQPIQGVAISRLGFGYYFMGSTIYKIDSSTGKALGQVTLPVFISQIRCLDSEGFLYVTTQSSEMYWLDRTTLATIRKHEYTRPNYTYNTRCVYPGKPGELLLTCQWTQASSEMLLRIDSQTGDELTTISLNNSGAIPALTDPPTRLYVTDSGLNPMSVKSYVMEPIFQVYGSTHQLSDYSPYGLAVNPSGTKLFFSHYTCPGLTVVDTATSQVLNSWNYGEPARYLERDVDGKSLWFVAEGRVKQVDIEDGHVIRDFNLGSPGVDPGHVASKVNLFAVDPVTKNVIIARGAEATRDIRVHRLTSNPAAVDDSWALYN